MLIQCRFEDETLWLALAQIAELFRTRPQDVTLHPKAIFAERELTEGRTCKDYLQVRHDDQAIQSLCHVVGPLEERCPVQSPRIDDRLAQAPYLRRTDQQRNPLEPVAISPRLQKAPHCAGAGRPALPLRAARSAGNRTGAWGCSMHRMTFLSRGPGRHRAHEWRLRQPQSHSKPGPDGVWPTSRGQHQPPGSHREHDLGGRHGDTDGDADRRGWEVRARARTLLVTSGLLGDEIGSH